MYDKVVSRGPLITEPPKIVIYPHKKFYNCCQDKCIMKKYNSSSYFPLQKAISYATLLPYWKNNRDNIGF